MEFWIRHKGFDITNRFLMEKEKQIRENLVRCDEPNAETLTAMKECESGVELEDFDPNELVPLDLSSFDSFLESLDR